MVYVTNKAATYLRSLPLKLAQLTNEAEEVGIKAGEAIIKKRVFNDGKRTDGNFIGVYSTKPFYATQDEFVVSGAFIPRGKNAPKTKSGKLRRQSKVGDRKRLAMYLPEGYKELRDIQGRETNYVNLQYSGDLLHSLQYTTGSNGAELSIYGADQVEKKQKLETKYSAPIFSVSDVEKSIVLESMTTYVETKLKTII